MVTSFKQVCKRLSGLPNPKQKRGPVRTVASQHIGRVDKLSVSIFDISVSSAVTPNCLSLTCQNISFTMPTRGVRYRRIPNLILKTTVV